MLLISRPVSSLYAEPDSTSEQVTQALLGDPIEVLEEAEQWLHVRCPDGYTGWIRRRDLSEPPAGWGEPRATAAELWVNLRRARNSEAAPYCWAFLGVQLPETARDDAWVELLLPDGRHAWCESRRMSPRVAPRTPVRGEDLTRTARRFLGVPYLWGGSSPMGLDCSGFVQYVYRLNGLQLLRDAHQQATQGRGVTLVEGRPGDPIFFGPVDRPERITHVGMLLGRGRYIHASGSRCVRIDSLAEVTPGTVRGVRRIR